MYFYNPIFGDANAALRNAFHLCGKLAVEGRYADITLAVPGKTNLDGMISEFIGEQATRSLQRDNKLDLHGLTLNLATQRIAVRHRGPVLAAFVSIKYIRVLAKSHYVTDLVYIPWQEDELPAFRKLFSDARPTPEAPPKDQ